MHQPLDLAGGQLNEEAIALHPADHPWQGLAHQGLGTAGLAINSSGSVVGYSAITDSIAQHAFLWTPTTPNGTTGSMVDPVAVV